MVLITGQFLERKCFYSFYSGSLIVTDSSHREFAWVTDLGLRVCKKVVVWKRGLTLEKDVRANSVHPCFMTCFLGSSLWTSMAAW